MAYHSLRQCVDDLEKEGELVRIEVPIDANLEAAAIQRRVFAAGGPALLFTNVVGCQFPMVSNLFGTRKRARFLFRDTYAKVQRLIDLKIDPMQALRHPLKYAGTPRTALAMLPKLVRNGPVMAHQTTLSQLPQMVSWPNDGGAYVTLPQVYTEDVRQPGAHQVEPRHVSHSAFGWQLHRRRGSWPALPNSSVDWRASTSCLGARQAVSGECFCRRFPCDEPLGGDATA